MASQPAIPHCLHAPPHGARLLHYPHRTALYRAGESIDNLWIIANGYCKLHRVSAQGRQVTIALLGPGAVLGTLDQRQTAEECGTAQGPLSIWRLERDSCGKLLACEAEFAQFIALSLGRHRDALQRRLFSLTHRRVENRLAAVLYDLLCQEGQPCIHGGEVDLRLTQQDLADLVGSVRQVVSTALNQWRDDGIIDYSRGFLCAKDMARLAELSDQ